MTEIRNRRKEEITLFYFFLKILVFLFILCLAIGFSIRTTQKESRSYQLIENSKTLRNSMELSLDNISHFLQFTGGQVLNTDRSEKSIAKIIKRDTALDPNIENFFSWLVLKWVNKNDTISISSYDGIIDKAEHLHNNNLLLLSKETPWSLHFGRVKKYQNNDGHYSPAFIPISMGIEDDQGKYIGSIQSNIQVERISRQLVNTIDHKYFHYAILDAEHNSIIDNRDINPHNHSLLSKLLIGNEDELSKNVNLEKHPFSTVIHIIDKRITEKFFQTLLPYIYIAAGIVTASLILFFIFTKTRINPAINQLEYNLAQETTNRMLSEQMLGNILENISGFVYRYHIKDEHFIAEYISNGCKELTGYNKEKYFGKNALKPSDIITPAHFSRVSNHITSSKTGKTFEISYPITTASGQMKWVINHGKIYINKQNGRKYIEGLLMDIDALKKTENALDNKIYELASSNDELRKFAYACSHDFKEPLRTIYSYTSLIERELSEHLTEKTSDYILFIQTSALRMRDLMEGLLWYSKINEDTLRLNKIDTNLLIKDVLTVLSHDLIGKDANIVIEPKLPIIQGDKMLIASLFQNLISNSIKFSTQKPNIHIGYNKETKEFFVKDQGIGIDKPYIDIVFEIFKKAHNNENIEGSGIGLSLCKRIVEKHGGDIRIESPKNKGTSIFFNL